MQSVAKVKAIYCLHPWSPSSSTRAGVSIDRYMINDKTLSKVTKCQEHCQSPENMIDGAHEQGWTYLCIYSLFFILDGYCFF